MTDTTETASEATSYASRAAAGSAPADYPVTHIPIERLKPSPLNPRTIFDKDYIRSLASSIETQGVIQAIVVRPVPGPSNGADTARYEIVAGECRWRASKLAKNPTVPAVVRELTDLQVREIQLIENRDRKNLSPLEEAAAFQHLIDAGKKVPEVAAMIGGDKQRSASYVYASLKLLELIPAAKEAMALKRMTAGHGIVIARLLPEQQKDALRWLKEVPELSVRELSRNIEKKFHIDLADAPWSLADALLVEKAGPCTVCPKKQQVGKKEVCTDPECWEKKLQAHVAETRAELGKQGRTLVMISCHYDGGTKTVTKGVITAENWRPAPKLCKKAEGPGAKLKAGIVTDGDWAHGADRKLGEIVDVCLDKQCKEHWGDLQPTKANPTGNSDIAAHQREWEKEKIKNRALRAARQSAAAEILKKTRWTLPASAVRYLVGFFATFAFLPQLAKTAKVDLKKLEREALKAGTKKTAADPTDKKTTKRKEKEKVHVNSKTAGKAQAKRRKPATLARPARQTTKAKRAPASRALPSPKGLVGKKLADASRRRKSAGRKLRN